ncbi:histone-binding protein N1/N2 isoform X3 [Salvelinus sp. IW2-2015]|uniref:histone-binding protein N1/N2 isoform X3 n=1 Tax=Salvelinus sp. IW2-2015 TaxID=2691554 RepID=UPI000CDFB98A|nr:histone-binding protein N1/N2 isoform X3 [Salvelinus alpinus]
MPEETTAASNSASMEVKSCSSSAVAADRAERYGDTADECGEAFFLCGKSLLELARMENTVLGDALEGVPEESSEEGEKQENSKFESADNLAEETRDELRMQVYDAMAEKETTHVEDGANEPKGKMETTAEEEGAAEGAAKSPVKNGNEHFKPPVNGVEKTPEGKAEDVNTEEQNGNGKEVEEKMEGEDDDEDEGEGTAEDEESEEEVGNLQLAWEMLEVAKVIYRRKENEADQLMAAQAYLKLGEVGAESGNYPAAVEDFQDCLALQLKHLPPHSRLLAETHYQLGMTYCYTGQYSHAIQHYSSSVKVIEGRLAMLQEVLDKGENGAEGKTELEELKLLLPDIAEKVEDAKESQRTAGSASVAIQQTLAGASTSSAFPASAETSGPSAFEASQIAVTSAADGASSKSALDISHLVRKKRKMEESPIKDTDAKKNKQETTVNGSGDSGSASNEVQEKGAQEPAKPSSDSPA